MSELVAKVRKRIKPSGPAKTASKPQGKDGKPFPVAGMSFFLTVLAVMSLLASMGFQNRIKLFVSGEVATHDVAADQNLQIEDTAATTSRREQVAETQPPVFDISPKPFLDLTKGVEDILAAVAGSGGEELEKLRWQISESLNVEIGQDIIEYWQRPDFHDLVKRRLLPRIKEAYEPGVVSGSSILLAYKNGILIRDLPSNMEMLRIDTRDIKDLKQVKDGLETILKTELNKPIRVRKAVTALIHPFLVPNLTLNQETTQARKREIMAAVEPLYYNIKKGEIIVRQGERVGPVQQLKLQSLFRLQSGGVQYLEGVGIMAVCALMLVVLHFSLDKRGLRVISDKDWLFVGTVLLIFGLLAKFGNAVRLPAGDVPESVRALYFSYSLPLAGAAGILALFFPKRLCIFATLILSFLSCRLIGGDLNLFCYYFISSMVFIYLLKRSETRAQVLKTSIPLIFTLLFMWVSVNLMDFTDFITAGTGVFFIFLNGLLTLLAVLGLSPIMELLFGYSSRFRLMELMNLEQPLLQELMVKAPGTYHHSLVVSNMVEAGARVIGANALLGRVAALYHDIGKLKSPQYFIENISGKENRHNKLTPSMSALILISHVKKGVELAREHKLGPVITDLISQHHGTTLITFFYHKAQELAEAKGEDPVREEEFRYPGPKPQSKEAGLILLADAIEASSRTLVDPTPSRIKGHIQSIVRKIYTEGELDESQLTLKDLTLLTETFHRILTGIFHQRIEYPSIDRGANKANRPKECPAEPAKDSPPAPEQAA
ncbi:HD family phosphohydrolase [Desulfolutivibrio sulfoxidireducens]|uniref:HD family phosphohydrolase n=1 Tax=Desulfolutivibrio sulfoxidireducens TaxID=2773299 RepID=UPI00159DF488|nr:HDIG domain-containing metalloprotein [Desulfolutivibrio sulfoxidireducens]QLA16557.1 HDIG domain-containing protein [Desulfolutivibrio sulfoxidireducens]QLA19561.1 HDIG domain-containing protein [Desulfolutivibrio sulfoxidireducens]